MHDPWQSERCARLLAALAAPDRLRIVYGLRNGPQNVTEIAARLGATVVMASHHLNVLRRAGLVRRTRHGRFMVYSLADAYCDVNTGPAAQHLDLGCCRIEFPKGTR